jgi:hypothetical protein
MPLVVPNTLEVEILQEKLTPALTMKLYSNDVTPNAGSAPGGFIEVAGGGYTSKPLTFANWNITAGDPSQAVYNAVQTWTFTGPTNAPGNIYGYFVTRNSDGKLMWAERFPAANVPFAPIAGSKIQVLPRFTAQSQF